MIVDENQDGQIQIPDSAIKTLARVLYPLIRDFYENPQPEGRDHQCNDDEQDEQSPAQNT